MFHVRVQQIVVEIAAVGWKEDTHWDKRPLKHLSTQIVVSSTLLKLALELRKKKDIAWLGKNKLLHCGQSRPLYFFLSSFDAN